jgi:hypothetical protein
MLQPDRLRAQIRYTNRILLDKLGRPALSLRPPAGAWNRDVLRAANQESLPLVLWSVVSGDVDGHVPAERMRRVVLEQAKPGAIVIFHINKRGPLTKKALPDIIAGLREKGFRFATVSQLLSLPDAQPESPRTSRRGTKNLKSPVPSSGESKSGEARPAPQETPAPDAGTPSQEPPGATQPPVEGEDANSSG